MLGPCCVPAEKRRTGSFYLSAGALLIFLAASVAFADPFGAAAHAQNESRGEWVTNLVWFIGGVAGSLTIIGFTRRKPPLEVEFLRREEAETRLQGLSNKIDALRAEMRADLASVAVEMRASDKSTSDQLQSIFERLGQLRGVK